jgi:ABC-2 type transport system permease protein
MTATETAVPPAPRPAVGRGPVHALRIGWLRGMLEIKEFFRQGESVFFTLAFPVMMLLIFGSILNYSIAGGALSFSHYFVPGILAAGLIGVAFQTLAIQIAVERDKGVLKRLEGTPMPPSSYFIGKVVMVLSLVLLESVILLALAKLLGKVDLPTRPGAWLTIIWVTLLGTTAGALMGIAYSSVPRSGKAAPAVVTPVALVLQFISGVYFVFTDLPGPMQTIGAVFPLKWIGQGYRSALLPDRLSILEPTHTWEHARTALVLALWVVGGLVISLRTFRWRSRKDA